MGFIQRQHDMAMAAVRGQPVPAGHPGALGGLGAAPGPAAAAPGSLLGGAADGAPLAASGVRPNYGANLGPIQPPAAAGGAKAGAPAGKAAPAR